MADATQETPRQEEDTRKVNLVSMDGDSFEVSRSVAAMSELVKTLVSGATLFAPCSHKWQHGAHRTVLFSLHR